MIKKKGEGREIRENNHGQTDGQTYIGTGIEGDQSGKKKKSGWNIIKNR